MSKPTSTPFGPVTTPRAFERVCNQIRAMLASGALKPGDKLPPERDLAAELGVARSVLREALRSLEIAGLLSQRKGGTGGSFITNVRSDSIRQAFEDMMILGSISLSDLTEARSLIMIDAITLACERATDADFDAIERNIDQTEEFTRQQDRERRLQAAMEFYGLIVKASRNQVLVVAVEAVNGLVLQVLRTVKGAPLPHLIEHRRRFLKFLQARDVIRASREMTTYLAGLHQAMLDYEKRHKDVRKSERTSAPKPPPQNPGVAKRSVATK
jgi:GntR family transcriptional regulator, transcriptional repressor for pyruvate dehydrogenase complex